MTVLVMSVVSSSAGEVCHTPCEPSSPCTDGCDESSCSPRNPLNTEERNTEDASSSTAPAPEPSSKLMRCEECRVGRWGPSCEPCNCAEDNCDQGIRGLGCADEGGIAALFGVVAVLLIITGCVLIGRRIVIKKELPTEVATHTVTVVDADSISGSPTRLLRKGPQRIVTKGNTGRASVWITKTVDSYTSFGIARGAVRNPAFGKHPGKKRSSASGRRMPTALPAATVSGRGVTSSHPKLFAGACPAAVPPIAKLNGPGGKNSRPDEDEESDSLPVLVEDEEEEDADHSHSSDKGASGATDERPSHYKTRRKDEAITGEGEALTAKRKAIKTGRVVKKKHKKKHKSSRENGSESDAAVNVSARRFRRVQLA
jgi:hypothetical protein